MKKPRPASRCLRVESVGRGCANPDSIGEPGFFIIGIENLFSYRSDWHQDNQVNPLVRQYQAALDSLLCSHPELTDCATHCVDCGIRFLTHPRNARRTNLRCPFACRRFRRRQLGNQRSAKHYATGNGCRSKKQFNGRRSRGATKPTAAPGVPTGPSSDTADEHSSEQATRTPTVTVGSVVLDETTVASSPMLPHIRMIVRLIEGVQVDRQQLIDDLCRALRQRSIAGRRRADYVLAFLNQHPP